MKQFSTVVVGTGFIGPVHVEALRRSGVRVAGILGSSLEKSLAAAQQLHLPKGYRDLAEVLADREVDAVHITTPNRHHHAQASAALRAGKHVLCEKPLAMDSHESAELVALAKQSRRAAGVAYNIRFDPLCHEAAARAREPVFGAVLHVAGSYVQDWLLRDTDFNWRVLAAEGGELRAVADIGTHWLDLAQFIVRQRIVAVFADLKTVHRVRKSAVGSVETFANAPQAAAADSPAVERLPITTDDYGCLLLRFDGGASGVVWVSQVTAGRKNCLRFEIAGGNQSLAWDSERPNELWIGHRDRPNELLQRDPSLLSESARRIASYPGGHNEGFPDTFKQLFNAFYSYIAAGDFSLPPPFPTFADGHHEVVLCEAVLRSHRERRWVELEEIER